MDEYELFFQENGGEYLQIAFEDKTICVEDLYQNFKARLLKEMADEEAKNG
jgi:hypothetical protein